MPTPDLDFRTAKWAYGPPLANVLEPRVPAGKPWEHLKREVRAMRAEKRAVRFDTVDRLCVRLGLHVSELDPSVWTVFVPRRRRTAA